MGRARADECFQRDPALVARWAPRIGQLLRWFCPVIEGEENLPARGPLLLVGNHSGGLYTPDAYALVHWWVTHRGPEEPLYFLGHDLLFVIPRFGAFVRGAGGLPASMRNARRALRRGASVLVYPGGDWEAFRPIWERGRVDFGGRTGVARLALELGVPVVPVVCHGSHDTTCVLSRGEGLAARLSLGRVRSKVFPLVAGLPWGVVPGFIPTVPLPAQLRLRFLPPLRWEAFEARAARDEDTVRRCYAELVETMQAALDELVRAHPWPLLDRWRGLARSRKIAATAAAT
ncbi:MAG: acyltransferase family protein [Deltaproteobacteria bacterium]|nr:acyltransferase family protein [Deltaproteobacteria bacterium]